MAKTPEDVIGTYYFYSDKTANYGLVATDTVIDANTSGGAFSLTLPTAVGIAGKIFNIKLSVGGNNLTIATTSSQTIDGATTYILVGNGDSIEVISDGANWLIVNLRIKQQVAVGTAQTADGTFGATSFGNGSNQPTLTFIANYTGKYHIYLDGVAFNAAVATNTCRINNSVGSATIIFSQESVFDSTASGLRTPFYIYMIASLVAGTSYTFNFQGKVSTGNMILNSSQPTNGIAIVAEQIE